MKAVIRHARNKSVRVFNLMKTNLIAARVLRMVINNK